MILLVLSFFQKYKKQLLLPTIVVIVVIFFFINSQLRSANPTAEIIQPIPYHESSQVEESLIEYEEDTHIFVEVKGAVYKPGVYELLAGDRVLKAIELAGGYLPTSDSNGINHAQKVEDEMVIYVPVEGEETEEGINQSISPQVERANLVNINKADEMILTTLPGIGPAKAEAIIAYRDESGLFKETQDLMKVTGIGKKTYEKLESLITVK
ncbi:competence protein ComEA [Psychrobacillus glaciei]|uniref:Competence protein ComEA n=1 Tax=Psychrobacillus glaciei TaxID=2283160 RepID=A0A5J6SP46_9BACI|nr:helix-hairpin-helix domain-containing protein [Psychrobacillus glaciei]QFF99499.1 competence protein ComEA [Psychrobacillus glaciei]